MFGGGAGGLAFMAGYAHGMIEIIGKEKLKEYEVGNQNILYMINHRYLKFRLLL